MCGSYCLLAFTEPLHNRKYYVRPIYKSFLEIILSHRITILQQPAHTRFGLGIRITGTPRIGKSTFLFYVAEKLKQEKIRLIITIRNITYTDDFRRIESHKAEEILEDTETVHLIDGAKDLEQHDALAVFFVSPTRANIAEYHLKNLLSLYMPLWSNEEFDECSIALGLPSYSRDYIAKWGGVYLDDTRAKLMEETLTRLLNEKQLIDFLTAVDAHTLSSGIENNQWLLHRIPCETETGRPYGSCTFSLPSDYVRRRIQEKLNSGVNLSLEHADSFICGHIYEFGVFKYLEQYTVSHDFLVVELHDKRHKSNAQKLRIKNILEYSSCSSPIETPAEYTLYKPRERNKKGLDAVLVQSSTQAFILQITINKKHPPIMIDVAFEDFPSK